jgi:hypothetical protein
VAEAQETEQKIDEELEKLRLTLANIEDARSFEELTVSSLCSFWLSYAKPSFRRGMLLKLIPAFKRPSRP